jgi:hypothetical protein
MTRDRNRPTREPTPEQLAAYLDGELTGAARLEVEAWVAEHPEAAPARDAVFADHDDGLARAWHSTQPSDPSAAAWSGVLGRIDAALPPPPPAVVPTPDAVLPARRRSRAGLVLAVAAAAAAAAVAAVLLGRTFWPTKPEPPKPEPERIARDEKQPGRQPEEQEDEKEPFPVALPTQVRVISMEGDDTHVEVYGQMVSSLVVGEPPVPDPELKLTSFAGTRLLGWDDHDLRFEDWDVPMIIDPVVLAKGWQP